MRFGILTTITTRTVQPAELARLVEQHGFESLWLRDDPAAYDPFIALTAAASASTELRLGIAGCRVLERDVIILAKEVASLDRLSGGRLLVGVDAAQDEAQARQLRERLLALKTLWSEDTPSFHGEHVHFDPVWSYPKPLQRPHPPLLPTGDAVSSRLVAEAAGGWMLAVSSAGDLQHLKVLEIDAQHEGLETRALPVTAVVTGIGAALLHQLEEAGIERVLLALPASDDATANAALDRFAGLRR